MKLCRTQPCRWLLFLGLLLAAAPAWPQSTLPPALYAVTYWEQKLITIDTNTGHGTAITNFPFNPRDLAVFQGNLYVYAGYSQRVRLCQVDALAGTILRDMIFTNKIVGGEGGMDFRADGLAFASTSASATGTLVRLELARTNDTLITADGGLAPSLDGLAFDADGTLFGLTQVRGSACALCQVDPASGWVTEIGDLGIAFPGASVGGLAFAPGGGLYAAVASSNESRLYLLDKRTGAAAFVGTVGLGGVSGLRFVAPPRERLAAGATPEGLLLAWPHSGKGQLETTFDLLGPWTNASFPVITNGAFATAIVPRSREQGYFRLRH